MRAVIQRVLESSVTINGEVFNTIDSGLLVFLGIEELDGEEDINWLIKKIINLRIFNDDHGVMNISLQDHEGSILLISQFTLHASIRKGNRPSYIRAAKPDVSIPIYEIFLNRLRLEVGDGRVKAGQFGADMKVSLLNDGPVTIIMDSKNKDF